MKDDNWFKPAKIMYSIWKVIGYAIMLGIGWAIGAFLNGVVRGLINAGLFGS